MILLDTNVVSELARPNQSPQVAAWVSQIAPEDLFLTVITEAELRFGLLVMPQGHRRNQITEVVEAVLNVDFAGRILPFDHAAAFYYAEITAARRGLGRPISIFDAQIAAIAKSSRMALATRNVRDFEHIGLDIIDPWEAGPETNP